jgi:DNA-binding XRE family transcriptional regulator
MARPERGWPAVTGPRSAARWYVNVDRIERARVLRAWTRKHLAGVAGVDPKTLTNMCSGRRRPSRTVQSVSVALGLTVVEVVVFEDPAPSGSYQAMPNEQFYGGPG